MEVCGQRMKEKRRNSEKRKEKSRDAARFRRSKESEIFSDLSNVLPIPSSLAAHLDKASIMRLVIAHLRIRDFFKSISLGEHHVSDLFDHLYLKALGGIVIVLSVDGEIIYVSKNVPVFLGVSQVDLLGQSIYDVSHPCDHSEIRDLLAGKSASKGELSLFVRIKCTLTNKGRNLNIKSASFKVLHVFGNIIESSESNDKFRFVMIAYPIPHPVDIEIPLGTYTFLSKHSLDMKFTYADERMSEFLGYNSESLIGKSLYNFHHAQDNKDIGNAFKSLFAKGQSETGQYRFLAQGGGFVWVFTQATLIYCEKGNKPRSVVCVNYVVSEKLNEAEIYSTDQYEWNNSKKINSIVLPLTNNEVLVSRPQPATSKIFVKRTADMNKGFLVISDDNSGLTMMKGEPEDLTHLAPTAGDVCVDLRFNEMVTEMSDNYCPLIYADKDIPLFSSYRDDCSNGSQSPTLKSPGDCSLPSLSSLGEDSTHFENTTMKSLLGIDLVESESDEVAVQTPYIPIPESDELPLLMSSDLLWNPNYSVKNSCNSSSESCVSSLLNTKKQQKLCDFSNFEDTLRGEKENLSTKYLDDQGGGDNDLMFPSPIELESRKRVVDSRKRPSIEKENVKKRKSSLLGPDQGGGSVLMNLLVSGQDLNTDYSQNIDVSQSSFSNILKK